MLCSLTGVRFGRMLLRRILNSTMDLLSGFCIAGQNPTQQCPSFEHEIDGDGCRSHKTCIIVFM